MLKGILNYTALKDEELFCLIAKENTHAFEEIYRRYANPLYSYAFKKTFTKQISEDAVQEVFFSLFKKRSSLPSIRNAKGYLFSCLRNFILNELRNFLIHEKHLSRIKAQGKKFDIHQPVHDLKLLEIRFNEALNRLSDRSKQVFLMSRFEQLPNKAIAGQLNISVNAVEKHMNKAMKAMRKEFK